MSPSPALNISWSDAMKSYLDRISINPRICHGQPCIKGTRVLVSIILDNLAAGIPEAEILDAFPSLKPGDIRAALAFAAEMTKENFVPIPVTQDS
jgi:uncharacterized protein (DUF433 family)